MDHQLAKKQESPGGEWHKVTSRSDNSGEPCQPRYPCPPAAARELYQLLQPLWFIPAFYPWL